MTSVTYLHSVLDKNDWNLQEIETFLEKDSSSVNEVNGKQETPLLRVLQKENCTVEAIELLLKFGANVNCKDEKSRNSLNMALDFSRNEDIIKVLLEKGVNVNDSSLRSYPSSLCLALNKSAPKSVVKLLLDAGCSSTVCIQHGSVLHCALHSPTSNLKQDVFQLLIDRGADVRANRRGAQLDPSEQTVLCFALRNGNKASAIQLLIKAGAPLNECIFHDSCLFCATNRYNLKPEDTVLKADVIKLLIQSGATVDVSFPDTYTPLRCALQLCRYETEAIKLLLGCPPGIDPNDSSMCLRAAMYNDHCNPTIVKLLIKNGVGVNGVDRKGDSALHLALQRQDCKPSVIKALLESGADVNLVNNYGETPLIVAMIQNQCVYIIEELLAAGAFIKFCMCHPAMKRFFREMDSACFRVLLRYFFLQISSFDMACRFGHGVYSGLFLEFSDKCIRELRKMKRKNIGEGFTLYEFISEYACPRDDSIVCEFPEKKYNIEDLLKAIRIHSYPLYFNVISAKVGKSTMTKMLEDVQVYAVTFSLDKPPTIEKKVILNYESVCNIARFVPNNDLLSLILAWYHPQDNSCTGQASNEKNDMYRRKAEFEKKC